MLTSERCLALLSTHIIFFYIGSGFVSNSHIRGEFESYHKQGVITCWWNPDFEVESQILLLTSSISN